jgi:hypothetical protein
MSDPLTYQQMGTTARGRTHTQFAQTMAGISATVASLAPCACPGGPVPGGTGRSSSTTRRPWPAHLPCGASTGTAFWLLTNAL